MKKPKNKFNINDIYFCSPFDPKYMNEPVEMKYLKRPLNSDRPTDILGFPIVLDEAMGPNEMKFAESPFIVNPTVKTTYALKGGYGITSEQKKIMDYLTAQAERRIHDMISGPIPVNNSWTGDTMEAYEDWDNKSYSIKGDYPVVGYMVNHKDVEPLVEHSMPFSAVNSEGEVSGVKRMMSYMAVEPCKEGEDLLVLIDPMGYPVGDWVYTGGNDARAVADAYKRSLIPLRVEVRLVTVKDGKLTIKSP